MLFDFVDACAVMWNSTQKVLGERLLECASLRTLCLFQPSLLFFLTSAASKEKNGRRRVFNSITKNWTPRIRKEFSLRSTLTAPSDEPTGVPCKTYLKRSYPPSHSLCLLSRAALRHRTLNSYLTERPTAHRRSACH